MKEVLIKNVIPVMRGESPEGLWDLRLQDGVLAEMRQGLSSSGEIVDGKGLHCAPSFFDLHVHLRDPGFTHKEDIKSGCAAALAGGVTELLAMPNTFPVCDSVEVAKEIQQKAQGTGVTVYSSAAVTKGQKGEELCDFKAFADAGILAVTDDGHPVRDAQILEQALTEAKKTGLLVISHCEDLEMVAGGIMHEGAVSGALSVKGISRRSEDLSTERDILLAEKVGTRLHIAHVSTKGAVEAIRGAKRRGAQITAETCPHYLLLDHSLLLGRDADYRMNPPLREKEDIAAVIEGLLDGTIDVISTDHAPHTPEEKANFEKAPNGVVGLETSFAAALTALYHSGKMPLWRVIWLMSKRPREILGLAGGELIIGEPVRLALFDPEMSWTVDPFALKSKSRNTPFKGMTLKGKVIRVI